jgi:hypothetical protein
MNRNELTTSIFDHQRGNYPIFKQTGNEKSNEKFQSGQQHDRVCFYFPSNFNRLHAKTKHTEHQRTQEFHGHNGTSSNDSTT